MAGRLTDSERFEHVRAWKASGKSRSEYGKRNGVSPGSLTVWKSQLRDKMSATELATATAGPRTFVELPTTVAPTPSIELQVGGVVVRVNPPVDVDTLVAVLAALEVPR